MHSVHQADQLTVDLARRAHQSPGRLVDEDGLRGLPLAQRTGQGQSGVVAFLVWELVRLQETLNRRRREDGLNSTHIFRSNPPLHALRPNHREDVDWATQGSMRKDTGNCAEFARERPPFCLRKTQTRDTIYTLFTLHALHGQIHYIHTQRITSVGQFNCLQWTYSEGG